MAKSPINKYELRRTKFLQYIIGVPAYEDAGESVSFIGNNAEANAKRRELDAAETDANFKWSIRDAVPLTDAELEEGGLR